MALHRPGALTQTGTHPFDCPLVLSRADLSLLPLSVHRCLCHTVTFSQMTPSTIEVIDTQFPCFILESKTFNTGLCTSVHFTVSHSQTSSLRFEYFGLAAADFLYFVLHRHTTASHLLTNSST